MSEFQPDSNSLAGAASVFRKRAAFRNSFCTLALAGVGMGAGAEPIKLEIIHEGFTEDAVVRIQVYGEDENGDGVLAAVPDTPDFIASTGGALSPADEVWQIDVQFSGSSVYPAFEATWDRTEYAAFNNYFTVFAHFSYDLEGGPVIGDGENEGYVLTPFDRPNSVAIGQKGLTVNGFQCELAGFDAVDCGMLQKFVQFEPFDPTQAVVDFGNSTATVRRVFFAEGFARPGVNDNVVFLNADREFWMGVTSNSGIGMDRIDPRTVRVGRGEAVPSGWFRPDLNGDGIRDLMVRVNIRATGATCGDTRMELYGYSFDDTVKIEAEDVLIVNGCP
ncbi:MAG: hypothetical protein ACX93N_12970 [Pseudohaliea sp.]